MEIKNAEALITKNGNLLVEANSRWLFVTPEGEFIKWSSQREWIWLSKQDGVKETIFAGEVEIPLESENVFTLWSGSGWDPEPSENREITLGEIFSLNVGDIVKHDATNVARWSHYGRLKILHAPTDDTRLIMSWHEELTDSDNPCRLFSYATIYLVARDGEVVEIGDVPELVIEENIL